MNAQELGASYRMDGAVGQAPPYMKGLMSFRTVFILILTGFVLLCAGLIVDSGFLRTTHSSISSPAAGADAQAHGRGALWLQQTTVVPPPAGTTSPAEPNRPQPSAPQLLAPAMGGLSAEGGPRQDVTIGSTDKATGFKYQLVLDSLGAGIRTATFSEYDTRAGKTHEPLVFLSPVQVDGHTILSMANAGLTVLNQRQKLRLDQLSWRSLGVQSLPDSGQAASFEATIVDSGDQPVLKLTKTYRIHPGTFLLDCTFQIENRTGEEQKVQYDLIGPAGLEYEGLSTDMRKAVAAFRTPQGQVTSVRLDVKALSKADTAGEERRIRLHGDRTGFFLVAGGDRGGPGAKGVGEIRMEVGVDIERPRHLGRRDASLAGPPGGAEALAADLLHVLQPSPRGVPAG